MPTSEIGSRILVWGQTGAGKSTLAAQVSEALTLPLVELDALIWEPGCTLASPAAFEQRIRAAVSDNPGGWVMDGSYPGLRRHLLPAADTVLWLNLPFPVTFGRFARRTLRALITRNVAWGHSRSGVKQAATTLRLLIRQQLGRDSSDAETLRVLSLFGAHVHVVRLRTAAEVASLVAALRAPTDALTLTGQTRRQSV